VSFRREKFIPLRRAQRRRWWRGGRVLALGDENLNTLIDYRYARRLRRATAKPAAARTSFGAAADDIVLRMPVGTIINDRNRRARWPSCWSMAACSLAKGGDGGFGNLQLTSQHQPRRARDAGLAGERLQAEAASCACWLTWVCWACPTPASRP